MAIKIQPVSKGLLTRCTGYRQQGSL